MQIKMREKKHRAGTTEDIEDRIDLNSGFQCPSMGASVGSQDGRVVIEGIVPGEGSC